MNTQYALKYGTLVSLELPPENAKPLGSSPLELGVVLSTSLFNQRHPSSLFVCPIFSKPTSLSDLDLHKKAQSGRDTYFRPDMAHFINSAYVRPVRRYGSRGNPVIFPSLVTDEAVKAFARIIKPSDRKMMAPAANRFLRYGEIGGFATLPAIHKYGQFSRSHTALCLTPMSIYSRTGMALVLPSKPKAYSHMANHSPRTDVVASADSFKRLLHFSCNDLSLVPIWHFEHDEPRDQLDARALRGVAKKILANLDPKVRDEIDLQYGESRGLVPEAIQQELAKRRNNGFYATDNREPNQSRARYRHKPTRLITQDL